MTDFCKSNLNRMILILLGFSLLIGLAPLIDPDFDWVFESFQAETDLLIPTILWISLSSILVSLFAKVHLAPRPLSSCLLIRPPIQ